MAVNFFKEERNWLGEKAFKPINVVGFQAGKSVVGQQPREFKPINGEVALVSSYAIYQLHKFIFVLAVFHVLYCITTLALGRTKVLYIICSCSLSLSCFSRALLHHHLGIGQNQGIVYNL
ncbi:hypothetical protein L1049_007428 [Liquidambar formosana]|uniref:Uncharacterized protein n=1 Tax=Liquidambar formosana TaxID=63359 RepID=A0AAP0QXU3_LIQFO